MTKKEYQKIKSSIHPSAINWLRDFYSMEAISFIYDAHSGHVDFMPDKIDAKYFDADIRDFVKNDLIMLFNSVGMKKEYVRTRKGQEFFEMGEK